MVTEVSILSVRPGMTPEDTSTEAGQHRKEMLEVLCRQPGYQRSSYGREIDHPDKFRMYIDWENIEAHQNFIGSSDYHEMIEKASYFIDVTGPAQVYHAYLNPHPATNVLLKTNSPVTEAVTLYFPSDISQSDKDAVAQSLRNLTDFLQSQTPACHGSAGGWAPELLSPPGSNDTDAVFVGFIGWDTVKDHEAYTETDTYKKNNEWLRDEMHMQYADVTHVSLDEGPEPCSYH